MPSESSEKVYYEQYQLREEGVGDAGGKLEAANKPDQGEVDRAKRGRAARGDRAGWPAEGRQVGGGGETGRSAKCKATQGHRAKWGRAARGDRVGVLVERQEKEEKTGRSAKYEATCEPKGGEAGCCLISGIAAVSCHDCKKRR